MFFISLDLSTLQLDRKSYEQNKCNYAAKDNMLNKSKYDFYVCFEKSKYKTELSNYTPMVPT